MNMILVATVVGLMTVASVAGPMPEALAQSINPSPCDYVNFVETEGGCIDPSTATGPVDTSLDAQFYAALAQLAIPILHQDCESSKTLGYYNISSNEMVFCVNNLKDNPEEFELTLVHESWHVVQDCEDGLANDGYEPVTLRHGDSTDLDLMASRLERADLRTIQNSYEPEDRPYEIEARYMEHHPDLVLAGLEACLSRQ